MSKHDYKPLYCIIAQNGGRFSVEYDTSRPTRKNGVSASRASREGYDLGTFDGLPDNTVVLDYSGTDFIKVLKFVMYNDSPTTPDQAADYLSKAAKETGASLISLKELRRQAAIFQAEVDKYNAEGRGEV